MVPIFIIGVSRAGSKFYMQLLNSHKEIYISPEILFRHPYKKDLYSIIQKELNNDNVDFNNLLDNLLSSNLKDTSIGTINLIDKEEFLQELQKKDKVSPYTVLDIILKLAAKSKNKSLYGAKYPIHFSFLEELDRYNLTSKILFLTRDPRDIYISDRALKLKGIKSKNSKFPFKGVLVKPAVLIYTILEWKKSLNTYEKYVAKNESNNSRIFKFENIITDQKQVINDVADLLNLSPNSISSTNMKVMDSSFNSKPKLGRWKDGISIIEKMFFKVLIGRKMKKYGY